MITIKIRAIIYKEGALLSDTPLVLQVLFDEEIRMYYIREYDLGLHCYGTTLQKLEEELKEDLLFLWKEYAQEDDDKLTASAILIKNNLLRQFRFEKQT